MIKIVGRHYYGTDRNIWQLSDAAAAERNDVYVEIVGWNDGCAYVKHPDWHALYVHLQEVFPSPTQYGCTYLVHVVDSEGKIVHIGSISPCYHKKGYLTLGG